MWLALDQWFLDAKFGLRQLGRAPLVATVAVVTLALGIGLKTAVFSLVHAVLLRPLPYPDADRLTWIAPHHDQTGQDTSGSRGTSCSGSSRRTSSKRWLPTARRT